MHSRILPSGPALCQIVPLPLQSEPTTVVQVPNDMLPVILHLLPDPVLSAIVMLLLMLPTWDDMAKKKLTSSDPIIVSIYLLAPLVPSNETLISCLMANTAYESIIENRSTIVSVRGIRIQRQQVT